MEEHRASNGIHSRYSSDTSGIYIELQKKYTDNNSNALNVDFRELLHWVKLGDQYTHLLHPYPAKLIPHIAHFFVNAKVLTGDNCIVLDPFCGSGTVALEASLAGHDAHISDANPLALLIARVKTFSYSKDDLLSVLSVITKRVKYFKKAKSIGVVNCQKWYSVKRKSKLELILRAVEEIENDEERDFFRVCFSVLAKRLSNADPAISVPVELKTKKCFSEQRNVKITEKLKWLDKVSILDEFVSICIMNIGRVNSANEYNSARRKVTVVSNNAMDLMRYYNVNSKPSLIITSPPYGSAQKYIRASSLSLNWLGFVSPENLTDLEDKSIGREHAPAYRKKTYNAVLPEEFECFLNALKSKNKTRYEITKQYLHEMKMALCQISMCLNDGGHAVLVTGNNSVCGEVLRNDLFVQKIMEECGLRLSLHLVDDIKSRGLMTKRNKTASIINRETVMVFRKEQSCE